MPEDLADATSPPKEQLYGEYAAEVARLQLDVDRRNAELNELTSKHAQAQSELRRLRSLEMVHFQAAQETAQLPLAETLKVVIVEDNPFDLELIKVQIEAAGISAEFVHAWDEKSVEAALADDLDVMLTDYNIPGLDVKTTLDMARRLANDLPVIVVTGYVGDEAAAECMRRGAADYVLKDSLVRLPQVIGTAVQQKRMRRATALARAEMFASESLKMAILESALDCVVASDMNGRIIEFNPAAEKTFGYEREEVLGKRISDVIIPPRHAPAHEEALARYPRSGHGDTIGRRIEIEAMRKDGTEFPVELALKEVDLGGVTIFTAVIRDITERREMERSLQASQERFKSLVQNSRDVIAIIDEEGLCSYVSPAVEELTGFSPLDVLGRRGLDFIHPDDLGHVTRELAHVMATPEATASVEARLQTRSGSWRWAEFRAANRMMDPLINGIVLNYHDITERKHSETKVRESEALFRNAFSEALNGIALIAGDGRTYVHVNDALCKMLGYTRDELLALTWEDITHPDDLPENLDVIARMITDGPTVNHFTKRYVHKDGTVIAVEITDSLVRDEAGNPLYFVTHIVDVTEREAAAQALRESEQLLQAVINNSPAAIFVKDRQGRYLLANERFNEAAALPAEAIIGKTAHDFWPAEFSDGFAAQDEHVFEAGSTVEVEEIIPNSDGDLRTYLTVKFPLFDENGECNALCGISTDVTERAKAATERERLETQLKQSQKMEAIGQLAGGVAHDFNNLLAVILNYADFLLEDLELDDPRRGDVSEISKAGDKAAGLVRQLLAFSRKEVIAPRPLDVNEVIADLHQLLRRSIGEDIELQVKACPVLPMVLADQTQLEQVVLNLAVNARDAMPQGGSLVISTGMERLETGVRPGLSEGEFVRLTVEDTGIGMDQSTAERIFEPFFTTKGQGEGTGLGLSTVYGIVKQAEGGVYADSTLGEGTRFHVYFPAKGDASPERASGYVHFGADRRAITGTVLLVEDEEAVRSLVSRILTGSGFEVIEFAAARDALAYCRSGVSQVDLLLTDVVMPDMSGKALSDELHAMRPALKTLYMSGYTDEIITTRGVLAGGEHLIQKPFKGDEIVARIRSLLDPAAPAA